jgi:branched-chain amino acid transport system permease protein
MAQAARWPIPLPLFPLVGAAGGLAAAALLGLAATRRGGLSFAMITLGIGELILALSQVATDFFGHETGLTINRVRRLPHLFGIGFGSQAEVFLLILAWCVLSALLLRSLTRTPLGRVCNAVRDNPERAEFIGYSSAHVRYLAFCVSGLFAGIAGALSAINFEIVNSDVLRAEQSGQALFMCFIGGSQNFFGPILGAVLITFVQVVLGSYTSLWNLCLGLVFIAVVVFAPGGLAGLLTRSDAWRPGARAPGRWRLSAALRGARR